MNLKSVGESILILLITGSAFLFPVLWLYLFWLSLNALSWVTGVHWAVFMVVIPLALFEFKLNDEGFALLPSIVRRVVSWMLSALTLYWLYSTGQWQVFLVGGTVVFCLLLRLRVKLASWRAASI